MCGRFAFYTPMSGISAAFDRQLSWLDTEPQYNCTPGRHIALIQAQASEDGEMAPILTSSWWGFRPAWAEDAKAPRPINARAETIATSRYFRGSFAKRRGLVPANGWYEWLVGEDGRKQPYYIRRSDHGLLMFGAIWTPTGDDEESSCAIITQPATPAIAHIHDRMPVLLDQSCWSDWLNPNIQERAEIRRRARPLSPDLLVAYPVSTAVNRPEANGPELTQPLRDQK